MNKGFIYGLAFLLTACAVGPDYIRPSAPIPTKYKEAPAGFQFAKPKDTCYRTEWWKIFNDPYLNKLEAQVTINNQNIAQAAANYQQARALVGEARAALFPTLSAAANVTRQKQGQGSTSFFSTSSTAVSTDTASTGFSTGGGSITNFHTSALDASWEPDIWGSVRRNLESNMANAQSSYAQLAAARLSATASLAQYYFQLRSLDKDQQILDYTVVQYKKYLQLTRNRYQSGIASRVDVVQAQSQLESAQSQAYANQTNRAQTEHAIAILLGLPPAEFSIPFKPLTAKPPKIPVEIPSAILEQRPDVASAERQMAAANAQVGVAIAAYFPSLTLSADGSYTHEGFSRWLSLPGASWSIAADLAQTIFDGGYRRSVVAAARATYNANVAVYRQTVLNAFQEVEDNLVSLRLLKKQIIVENQAAKNARTALQLITNQYKAGTVDYTTVITAQNTAYNTEMTAADIAGQEMVSAVLLIKALGGGWDACPMCCAGG